MTELVKRNVLTLKLKCSLYWLRKRSKMNEFISNLINLIKCVIAFWSFEILLQCIIFNCEICRLVKMLSLKQKKYKLLVWISHLLHVIKDSTFFVLFLNRKKSFVKIRLQWRHAFDGNSFKFSSVSCRNPLNNTFKMPMYSLIFEFYANFYGIFAIF